MSLFCKIKRALVRFVIGKSKEMRYLICVRKLKNCFVQIDAQESICL